MKDAFEHINSNILQRIINSPKIDKSNLKESFPKIGFFNSEKITFLENLIDLKIKNIEFYEQAFTHRSYQHVLKNEFKSNERLEFLGDAVLQLIITKYLFMLQENDDEGDLTKIRSWLVNRHSLAAAANALSLNDFVMMSYGAKKNLKTGGSKTIMADALESLIAAIYLDSGFEKVEKFVLEKLLPIMINEGMINDKNYKSNLLEIAQSLGYESPIYKIIDETGPSHNKTYTVSVIVNNIELAHGTDKTKKEAEQAAAQEALKNLNLLNQS